MFKERVGAIIIYLYLRLHRYRAKGGDLTSFLEEGKKEATKYLQEAGEKIPETLVNANASAKVMLLSTASGVKEGIKNPGQTAGEVVEKLSDSLVGAAKTARDALRGEDGLKDAKEVVKEAIETAKGEAKGAVEQGKRK
jgi:hypothetical protein